MELQGILWEVHNFGNGQSYTCPKHRDEEGKKESMLSSETYLATAVGGQNVSCKISCLLILEW